jgi:hypothetical protein
MKTKTIEEKEFSFRDKNEITWGAENRARDFIKKHLLEIDANMIGMMKGATIGDARSDIDFDQMFSNPTDFAKYMQAVEEQKEKNEIAAIMLVTNLEYSDLEELPVTTMTKLGDEVTAIVKDATDFLNGLGINTQSKLMTESQTAKPEVKTKT